jgi:hypothetical protein
LYKFIIPYAVWIAEKGTRTYSESEPSLVRSANGAIFKNKIALLVTRKEKLPTKLMESLLPCWLQHKQT